MIYAIDFDGTLCEDAYPNIGEPKTEVIDLLRDLTKMGHKLILNTCREDEQLKQAKIWCAQQGLVFDEYNENVPERIVKYGGDCRKISADFYIDDKNLFMRGVN